MLVVSTTYKIFYLDDLKLAKTFSVSPAAGFPSPIPFTQPPNQNKSIDAVEIDIQCPKCNKRHQVNGYMDISSQDIQKRKLKLNLNVKENDILICDNCNFALDLKPIKNQVETQTKRKISFK